MCLIIGGSTSKQGGLVQYREVAKKAQSLSIVLYDSYSKSPTLTLYHPECLSEQGGLNTYIMGSKDMTLPGWQCLPVTRDMLVDFLIQLHIVNFY